MPGDDDDLIIDPAWAESFTLDLDPEQTLRAAVDSATAETLPMGEAAPTVRDDPTTAETLSLVSRAATIVQDDPSASGGGSNSGSVPTRRLLPSRDASAEVGVDADYLVSGELGAGGMGVVYAAEQASLGRTVALKRQRPERAGDPALAERFVAEAMVTGLLEHPNIVPVYELGEDAAGGPFYTMKLIQGSGWDQLIDQRPLEENLETWQRVADGIAFAHSKGLVHCDLKPANVMLGAHGEVLVVDWGLAMRREAEARFASPIAPGATVGGTPAYMPPELARLDRMAIGPCTDIYLLGALLFRLVTGRPPHAGDSLQSCMRNAGSNVIVEVDAQPEHEDVLAIARRAMATEPAARFADVQAMQEELRQAGRRRDSRLLLTRADELAAANATHMDFDRALEACAEARELWPGNPAVAGLASEIRCRYARVAMERQDNALAVAVLQEDKVEEAALLERARQALAQQQRRRRHLRLAVLVSLGLGLVVAGALMRAMLQTEVARAQAELAREQSQRAWEQMRRAAARTALSRASVAQRQHDYRAARAALATVPEELRGWEWRILHHATHGDHRVLELPGIRPRGVAWSADGKRVYLVDIDGAVFVIDAEEQEVSRRYDTGMEGVADCHLSPDGERLLLRSRRAALLLDLDSGQVVQRDERTQRDCRWYDTERYLLLDDQPRLVLRSWGGEDLRTWTFDQKPSCVFVDDQRRILVGVDGLAVALDAEDDEQREPIFDDGDGRLIAIAQDREGLAFLSYEEGDSTTGGKLGIYLRIVRKDGSGPVEESVLRGEVPTQVGLAAEGFAFSIPRDKAVYLKGEAPGTGIRQMLFPQAITAMAVHPDGRRLACARAGALHLGQPPPQRPLAQDAFTSHQAALALTGDALYTIDIRGAVYRRDPRSGRIREELVEPGRLWTALTGHAGIEALSDGGLLVCTGRALSVLAPDGLQRELVKPSHRYMSSSLSPDRTLAASTVGRTEIALWEMPSGREIMRFRPDPKRHLVPAICWSPDGTQVAVPTTDRYLLTVDVDTQEIAWRARVPFSVTALRGSRAGPVVAFADRIHVYSWTDGERLVELHGHQADISTLTIAEERSRLISGDMEGWLLFWDMERWEQTLGIRVSPLDIFCIDSAGDRLVFAARDWMLRCWDLAQEAADGD